jgi:uncharacterized short protein YbdD (DUF466 family)
VKRLRAWLRFLRRLTGDDAYERYLAHQSAAHPGIAPLDRRAFYLDEQRRKWSGAKRCC